jgi:hypothetical protein
VKQDTQTYCFGRFLIDLPKTAEVNGQAYEFMFGKIESERFLGGAEGFEKKMKESESTFKAVTREGKYSYANSRLTGSPTSRILVTSRTAFGSKAFGFEAYRYLPNGILFSMKEKAFSVDKIDSVLQRLETRLLPNLRYRSPGGGGHAEEIPTEPGFCIEKGFIADDGKTPQYEYAELNFRFKQWPDVSVRVYSRTNGDKLEESLLSRMQKPFPPEFTEAAKQIKTLRKGAHDVGPLHGEEALETYPTDHGYAVHHLVWDAQGALKSTTEPAFYLELQTGRILGSPNPRVRPSLTDKQAIELFDAIVNSIRLRLTPPGKSSDASSPDAPSSPQFALGSRVSSAANCPQSGMWECAPDAPGISEHRRFIEAGQPMPYGYARAPKPGLPGLLGTKEDNPVEIVWTLAAYEKGTP